MGLTLNSTPEKTVGNYSSKVVFANPLPVLFEIDSDTAPTNLQPSSTFSVTDHSEANGYAYIEVAASATGIACGDFVTISTNLYNGTYKVLSAVSSTFFLLEVAFVSSTTPITGTIKRFYNNYYIEAKIYAGIPTGHFHYLDNPMREIATIRNTPIYIEAENTNRAYFDVSGAIRASFLPVENEVCTQRNVNPLIYFFNDIYLWVAFYIEYREVYDSGGDGCDVTQNFGIWETSETYYAINGTSQFQYEYGGNAGEYVFTPDNVGVMPVKFLTTLEVPYYWFGQEFDLFVFMPPEAFLPSTPTPNALFEINGVPAGTVSFSFFNEGVYRLNVSRRFVAEILPINPLDTITSFSVVLRSLFINVSNKKEIKIISDCSQYEGKHITYLNTLGGFDYLFFGAGQDVDFDNIETQQTERNIFDMWDSYFTGGTTQLDNIRRITRKSGVIRSYPLNKELFKQYCEQLSVTVKMQEILQGVTNEACSGIGKRRTIIPKNELGYSDTNKDYTVNLQYEETNETLSQWQ